MKFEQNRIVDVCKESLSSLYYLVISMRRTHVLNDKE